MITSREPRMAYAHIEAARFIGSCAIAGAILGTITAYIRGDRHAH